MLSLVVRLKVYINLRGRRILTGMWFGALWSLDTTQEVAMFK